MPNVKVQRPTVGQTIKRLREKSGQTQQQTAEAIGYTGTDAGAAISRIESGAQQPRLSTLRLIAKALGVSLAELIS